MIGCADYTLSAHKRQPENLGAPLRQHRAGDHPGALAGRDHIPEADVSDRLLGSVGHQDRRIAGQAPSRAVLRAAEAVGFVSGVRRGDRAVGPGEAPLRGLVGGPITRRTHRQDAGFAFDHDVSRVRRGGSDQGDSPDEVLLLTNPLRPDAGLPPPAAGFHEPDAPVARRRELFGPRPRRPVVGEGLSLRRAQAGHHLEALGLRQLEQRG